MGRALQAIAAAVGAIIAWGGVAPPPATAQEKVTLRLHHFSSPRAIESLTIIQPLADAIKRDSNGTIDVQVFPGMQLGGKPSDLLDQVLNGVVDIVYTLPGYHPGRFTILEGLELPFVGSGGEAMSVAGWEFIQKYGQSELKGLKLLTFSGIDTGFIQTSKTPVRKLEDMRGLKIRVASRYIGIAVQALGAVPVQMPLPAVYEAMARGQVQGMAMPWVITIPFKLQDVAQFYTEVPFYTSMLLTVMNQARYDKLSPAHKAVIDKNIGVNISRTYGKAWDDSAESARNEAIKKGKEVIKIDATEQARWRAAAKSAHEDWVNEMNKKGLKGREMLDDMLAMIKRAGG
jgi:TRAP-type C4-dicarboxylate transport system substrate-binding protein